MRNVFLAFLSLLFVPLAQAEFQINGIAFHVTPMERRLVLHPVAGECDFSRYGHLELGFRVKGDKPVPVRVALRDNTRRINDPESRSLQRLSPAGAGPVPMRIYFAGNADFGYVIDPARIGRILIETDTPELFRQLPPLDLLINNAGIHSATSYEVLEKADLDECREVYDVNALGPLRVVKAFLSLIPTDGTGMIVNISSDSGSIGTAGRIKEFDYCMSKAALNMASCIILNGIRKKGGAVINLHPGWMQSVIGEPADPDAPYAEPAAPGEVKYYTTPEITARGFLKILDEPERFSGHMPGFVNYRGDRMNW